MRADWSAACAADDPTLVVPWSDAGSDLHFIDLRADPYALADIAETEPYPELGRALRALNAPRSPVFTAKCDVWSIVATASNVSPTAVHGEDGSTPGEAAPDEMAALALELDLPPEAALFGVGCYIDLLWRERALFTSAGQNQLMLDRLVRRFERLQHANCVVECVLRPALMDFGTPLEGYAVTLYLRGADSAAVSARMLWAAALDDVVNVLRTRLPGSPQHTSIDPKSAHKAASATLEASFPLRMRHLDAPPASAIEKDDISKGE